MKIIWKEGPIKIKRQDKDRSGEGEFMVIDWSVYLIYNLYTYHLSRIESIEKEMKFQKPFKLGRLVDFEAFCGFCVHFFVVVCG